MYEIELLLKKGVKRILKKFGVNNISRVYGVPRSEVASLFNALKKKNINYLVLRWFENLPLVNQGEDIDILVADEDFEKIKKLLKRGRLSNKNFVKIDLFPVTSQKRFMAYYPPHLAKSLLHNKVLHKSNAYIPADKDYFLSLTYHVLFHKGFASGIKSKHIDLKSNSPEHDYENYLINLMRNLNLKTKELTLEKLEQNLKDEDWLPPLDIYFRRSAKNSWVYYRALESINELWRKQHGLVVFIIRDMGYSKNLVTKLKQQINLHNAKILSENILNKKQAQYLAHRTRGGDWGKGPSVVSGGFPKFVIVCKSNIATYQPCLENIPQGVVEYNWVKSIKIEIRNHYTKNVSRRERCNIIHSSDNGVEASHYLNLLNQTIKL
ncbi:hypothetical protein N8778_01395 [Verrucomicrobia bacterium]|nr:hypothetical protein [Verrucomicrobiota bacterium]